jgi:NADPH2:quinone reductase
MPATQRYQARPSNASGNRVSTSSTQISNDPAPETVVCALASCRTPDLSSCRAASFLHFGESSRRCTLTAETLHLRQTKIVVTRYGGPEVITVAERECPAPGPGEIQVKVLAAGVSLPDVLAREGVHPETPRVPYTPGWDLVGLVNQIGEGVSGFDLGQTVAAMPISGCYAQYVCLPQRQLIPVPAGLDPAEAVAVVLNYITAYQMLNRSAKAKPGQRVLIHGASGGVGTALLQLGRLAGVEMYGTCSAPAADVVKDLGATPIDYRNSDFVREIHRLTGDGVDAVFDGIGGDNLWRSREALREGGRVVVYGFQAKLKRGRMAPAAPGGRHPVRESAILGWHILRNWFLPGRKSMVPYSIQWLMRLKPALFRHDLLTLFELLQQKKIEPLIARRLPLSQARLAHELLGSGGVIGKIVLMPNGSRSALSARESSPRCARPNPMAGAGSLRRSAFPPSHRRGGPSRPPAAPNPRRPLPAPPAPRYRASAKRRGGPVPGARGPRSVPSTFLRAVPRRRPDAPRKDSAREPHVHPLGHLRGRGRRQPRRGAAPVRPGSGSVADR